MERRPHQRRRNHCIGRLAYPQPDEVHLRCGDQMDRRASRSERLSLGGHSERKQLSDLKNLE